MIYALKKYFKNNTPEKIKSDWVKSKEYDSLGPSMDEFLEVTNKTWRSIETLPTKDCKVVWKCIDGIEDVGYYWSDLNQFGTIDPKSEKQITHWKPLVNGL